MGGRRVRVFHISDLHMRGVDGPQRDRARLEAGFRWRVLGEKWTANLAELRKDGVPFDLVVFTGDLGDWGEPTDYPRAVAFLKETCTALDVPHERLFVVPGNHDIARGIQPAAWESLRGKLAKDPRACSKWMAGADVKKLRGDNRRDAILERQQAFWAAVATELGRPELIPSQSPHGRLGYRCALTLPELSQPLHVIGLDTAWLAGDDHDTGQLRLTEHQVSMLTTTADGAPLPGLRLALMHHRLADLADGAEARKLLTDRVDLLLHGHQHEPTADVFQGPDHQLLVLAAGCLYEGDEEHRHLNTCQVIDLELDAQTRPRGAVVRFRGWSARGLFWGDDALLYQKAPGGRLRLSYGTHGWRFGNGEAPPESARIGPATDGRSAGRVPSGSGGQPQTTPVSASPMEPSIDSMEENIDLLIATALTEEAQVVAAVMSRVAKERRQRGYVTFYDYPLGGGGTARVATVSAHQVGAVNMGVFMAPMLKDLRPRSVTLIGIAAAIDTAEVALGDVPFASQVLSYDDIAVEDGILTFRTEGYAVDPRMRRAVGSLRLSPSAYQPWQDECLALIGGVIEDVCKLRRRAIESLKVDPPHLVVGATAGGPFLLRDRGFSGSLREHRKERELAGVRVTAPIHPKLVSAEMESHGFMRAAHEHAVPATVIKGISDVGDQEKAKLEKETGGFYRAFACSNAVLAALHILRHVEPRIPNLVRSSDGHSTGVAGGGSMLQASRSASAASAHRHDVVSTQARLSRAEDAPPGAGNRSDGDDHVRLYNRLVKLPDPLFEQLLLVAKVPRSLFSPRTAPLATRAQEVAELAQFDSKLCLRLTDLLEDKAPWTRDLPPPPLPEQSRQSGAIAASAPSVTVAANAASQVPTPIVEDSTKVFERLARMRQEVVAILRARPRPFTRLAARIGCEPELLAERLVNLRGSLLVEHIFAVYDEQPSTPEGNADRDALQSVLFTVLPYVSDWRAEVAECCARGEGEADAVELRYRSDTIAEAVMAGWMGRRCVFEHKAGAEPYGAGVVQIPATEQTALFTSEQTLLEGVVNQLRRQFGTAGLDLDEQRLEVEEELRLQGKRVGLHRMRYYFLFRDTASRDDPGTLWRLARTTLHGENGLRSLILVRMQGRLDAEQAALNRGIAAMLKPRTPS